MSSKVQMRLTTKSKLIGPLPFSSNCMKNDLHEDIVPVQDMRKRFIIGENLVKPAIVHICYYHLQTNHYIISPLKN